jgi:hypothetical protein
MVVIMGFGAVTVAVVMAARSGQGRHGCRHCCRGWCTPAVVAVVATIRLAAAIVAADVIIIVVAGMAEFVVVYLQSCFQEYCLASSSLGP